MEADSSKEKEWEKRGGTIVSTTDSKGRVRRTFVNSDGEKFKSWKECEHYLAYTDAYGGAEKASHESQSAEHKANSAMKRSTVSGASAEKDSTESNKNKAAMEKEKKVVNDNNKTGSGMEKTKIEDKEEEEGIKKQQSKVNETARKNSKKSAGKVEMEIKPNKPTDKVTSSAKKTVKKPSKEDEVAVKSSNNKANKEDTKVERNKSEEENTSNGKKIMKDKKGNGSNTKKEQKDTDIEPDTDQKEAKEENESNEKKIAKGKKVKGNETKKEEKDTDIKPDRAKEAANDNANTPKSKKKESDTAGSGKEKTKNTSKTDGNSKRNITDADVVSRRGKTKGNDAKDNKKKEESEANDRKQMTKESPGSGKKRKKENESAENSEKKRNRDEMDARDCSKKKTRPEHESKRKLPKRAAACDDFKAVSAFRLTKSDFVKGSKKEKVEDNENDAVEMTETSKNVYGGIVQRRLTDFIVHDSDGNSQSIEMSEVTDLFITGAILPMDEVGTVKRVRCEGFGRVDSWSITGYEEGVPTIWFATECAEYMCLKPNSHYKKYFDMFFEKAALCVEVYRALSKPDGGDPLLGFDEMVARVARSLNGKKNSGGRSFGKDYIISHGEFVSKQLIALDKNSKGADQLFTGLPALVTLESEGKKVDNLNNNNLRASSNRGIIISENVSSLSPLMSAAEDVMDEDEKLARLLQEEENWKSSKYQQRSWQPKKKCYIKINEKEIANDYPMPAFYKPTEDETDEYLFFDDAPTDAEQLPRRMLHDWTLYNAESRLVPLELLPMSPDTESDIDIFGSGIMAEDDGSGYCLEGDVEVSQSSLKADHPQGIRIYLSAIKEWMIEFGASMLFISVRTDGAWYRLGNPSRQYFPWYQPVLKTARVAIKIITMLKDESRVSKLSFSDVIRKLTEQARKEPTFIANNVEDVERYIVVHGQIILQQFAEYPDDLIRRSAFITGLTVKMEQRQHTKLFHTKTTIIIKEKNLNPRASFAVDTSKADASRRKQMHATTTKLIYGIWKDYYSCSASTSNVPDENEAKEIVEQEDQEQSDEEDEVVVVTENKFNVPSQVKVKRGKSAKTSEWIGKSAGKLPSGEPLYRKALANGIPIAVGGAITVESYGAEDLTVILLIEYMFESSDGAKTLHGRFLERACQTVLGNAADDREVFLTMNCSDLALDCVKDSVPLNVWVRPWGTNYRKENAAADERERAEAKESEKKQIPSGYYCKSLYAPEKGAFLTLPLDTLGLGTGQCHGCSETKNDKEFELFESEDGFTFKGIDYHLQDFVYIDPAEFQPYGEVKEIEKFKGGMSKGLRAYAVCQIININAGSAQKNDAKSTKILVRRFFRPEDIGPEKAYHADVNEVYYSQETSTVFISSIQGRCDVKRQQYYAGNASFPTFDHTFWCNCVFDPSKGTVKQLPVNVKLSSSGTSASPDGNAHASNITAKAKGKGILDETTENAKADYTDSRLATLDIFAGCGGLSLGLQQSGACLTKWAIEYEQSAAEAFKLNHPEAEVFCDNCNVILRAIMEKSGDEAECISTAEATDKASKLSDEQRKALPVPGQVDFINGGPPCQGFSGMNRFNMTAWSKVQCEMILGFLSYADYFRPKYFLLENVRNFVSFNKGQTFRLTLRSLLDMGYQVRFGVLQAGNYGISQSRKRAFIWAASPDELLPEWPEPMHVFASSQIKISLPGAKQYAAVKDAAAGAPFRTITVRDTIGDLPPVANGADEQEMQYQNDPVSWFQKQIRGDHGVLYDHISKEMNELNLIRCQRIPKRPGADWRDLPEEKVKLSTGQLVDLIPWCLPNTADRHNQWKGLFGRLDWEGSFSTSVTDPQPMGKVGMCFHPEQDRIVTVRECARSQGFPDNFKFCGNILHKHRQIGNAVPPPLAAALGIKLKEAVDAKKSQ